MVTSPSVFQGARNAAPCSQENRRPARVPTAVAVPGAPGGPATFVGGMTGPNIATRVGAAFARRRPASPPPDAPPEDAQPEDTPPDAPNPADPRPATEPSATEPPAAAPSASSGGPSVAPAPDTALAPDTAPDPDATPAPGTTPAPSATTGAGPRRPPLARALAGLRRHWLAAALLAAGLVLRALAVAAYHPALIYVDTLKYLYGASPGSEPFGYTVALKIVLAVGDLGTVAILQHLLGLGMAVTVYVVLLRRGVPRWAAALTTAPVLLDAYQVQMEQTIMPDVLFEAIVVAGLAVLLWRPVVTVPFATAGGLVLAASATVMQLGVILVAPALIYVLAVGGGWRRVLSGSVALVLAFGVLILGYCGASYARDGHFWLARHQTLTGRLMAAADCATLQVPPAAKRLCPTPAQQALGPDWLEHSGQSPLFTPSLPRNVKRGLINDLTTAVLGQQELRVLGSIARDSVRLFALTREETAGVTPLGRWQFQAGYPAYPPWVNVCAAGSYSPQNCMLAQQAVQKRVAPVSDLLVRPGGPIVVGVQRQAFGAFHASTLRPGYGGPAQVDLPLAKFLRAYQLDGGYTPGPLLVLCTLAGLAGSLVLLRRRLPARTRLLGLACLLFTGTAIFVLFAPDVYQYSWRYELPAVITLVPAGVLGAATLLSLRGAGRPSHGAPATAEQPPPE